MKPQDWNRLQKNWKELKTVDPEHVIPYLYQCGILERPNVKYEGIYSLLEILQHNESPHCFRSFVEALEKEGYDALVRKIETTEASSDPAVKSRGDPALLEPKAREILLREFIEKDDTEVPLQDIKNELANSGVFKNISWSNDKLKEFLFTVFNGIEIPPAARRRQGGKRPKLVLVKNLCKVLDLGATGGCPHQPEEEQTIKSLFESKRMKDLSPAELKQFLLPKLTEEGLPVECLDILEKEDISGKIFLNLEGQDLKEVLPDVSFGCRFFLMQCKEPEVGMIKESSGMESLREFDKPVSHFTVYTKGLCCDISNCAKDKTTRPVKLFCQMEGSSKHELPEYVASEIIPFVAACLNDRRNGTIYFGINKHPTSLHLAGEIVGISLHQTNELQILSNEEGASKTNLVSQESVLFEINRYLEQAFSPHHQEIIRNTVRDAKFIPVKSRDDPRPRFWVIEMDVIASAKVLKREIIHTFLKLLPVYRRKNSSKEGVFRFSSDGTPKLLDCNERHNFERSHPQILALREQDEMSTQVAPRPNLRTKLLNLLTGGNEVIKDMMFSFLVLSPFNNSSPGRGDNENCFTADNLQFVKHLGPEIVFDFDSHGSETGVYKMIKASEVTRVLTTDNFDESKCTPEQLKEQESSLGIEKKMSWFFCNGYKPTDIMPMSAIEWNKKRKSCFQECLRLFISLFGKERVTVLICVLSKDCDIMADASGEILGKLSDNWMVLAESEEVAQKWQEQMLDRKWVDRQDLDDRCVIGMPWRQVNTTIQQVTQQMPPETCLLPASTGAYVKVKEKKIKDWAHIDVLSADFKPSMEDDAYSRKVEEGFYRGEQAQWTNFYFKTQVLVRDIHRNLKTHVDDALRNPSKGKRNKVAIVRLTHQPMAGGTTSAKQVLWDLRQTYRCCVVKSISEHTAQELNELHKYDDPNPKPLLVLFDNENEDKLADLLEQLEDQGQRSKSYDEDDTDKVYCVAIVCKRRTSDVPLRQIKSVLLKHELSRNELQWFLDKDKILNQRFEKDEMSYTDPKFLIAFNIMKKKFDPKYIETTLSIFTDSVDEERETKLLKMVCFLNLYDPDFTKISVSCLDDLLLDKQKSWGKKGKMLVRNQKWEACLSPAVKVLLNISSESLQTEKNRSTVSTFNTLVAKGVLKRIMQKTGQKVSEIMLELLDSSMFVGKKHDTLSLIDIISNIVKTRVVVDGIKPKFSQFLSDIKKEEGSEVAVYVLEQVLEMNNDPFTAQLIARFYMIELKDWENAEIYARRATSKLPTNPFLWDTYAQVFQHQLQDEISNTPKISKGLIQHWIYLSMKTLEMFQKEEEMNEAICEEYETNLSCYFGELRAIELILNAISKAFEFTPPSLQKFLVDPNFVPEELAFLTDEEKNHFKTLKAIAEEAFTRFNDEYVQMKKTIDITLDTKDADYDFQSIGKLSLSLEKYFGQNTVPRNAAEKEFYHFSWAKKLGGTHLCELLNLRGSSGKLQNIYELMQYNVKSEGSYKFEYLLTAVASCTVLMIDNRCPRDLDFNTLLSWCSSLIELNKRRPRGRYFLEPYLYYTMYNFPTEERSQYELCSKDELRNVMKEGTAAFMKNNPRYAGRWPRKRRVTTLFFLGSKGPLKDIVHMDMLPKDMKDQSFEEKWQIPEISESLRQLEGTLLEKGNKVKFSQYEIQTSHPIEDTSMWQKRVSFYVGFGWAGPQAYGIKPVG